MHGFREVDGIEDPDVIAGCCQELAGFHDQGALGVGHYDRRAFCFCTLHDVGFNKKPCFAGTGSADDQHVFFVKPFFTGSAAA